MSAPRTTNAQLYRAARSADVDHCRVGTGRLRTCVCALAMHLGLAAT